MGFETIRSAEGPAKRSGALHSYSEYFAVTMKKTGSVFPTSQYYYSIIDQWEKKGIKFYQVCYELDSDNRLHLHGTIGIPKNFYRKSLNKKELHYMLVPIEDQAGLINWTKYIEKQYDDVYQQEQLLQTNDIQVSSYPFVNA